MSKYRKRPAALLLFLLAVALPSAAQTRGEGSVAKDLDLNITQERITETNFFRSTALDAAGNNDVTLHAGASISAGRIDLTLRGVIGRVRFRGSLGPLARLLTIVPKDGEIK